MTTATAPSSERGLFDWLGSATPPWLFAGLLSLIVIVGEVFFDILGGFDRLLVTLGIAFAAEWGFSRVFAKRKGNTISAYITGNSVLVLTKPAAGLLWPFALGPLLAIGSKFALTYKGQHLWNPTNLSFSLLLIVAPGSVAILSHQWGNQVWIALTLMALGFVIAGKAKLLHIPLTYVVSFCVLAWARAIALDGPVLAELAPITGPVGILFTFFMLTDPKTVVRSRNGRMFVVVLIALVECGIRMADEIQLPDVLRPLLTAPPIFALAIVGPVSKFWDIRRRMGTTA